VLVLLDGAAGRVPHAGQHEICHRPALQLRGIFDQVLLIGRDTRLQTFPADTAARRLGTRGLGSWFGYCLFSRRAAA
jgi:hypothetical protein